MANLATDPIRGWDRRALVVNESAFRTTPDPASAQAIELHDMVMGGAEQGVVRPKKDKTEGRGMTNGFVEGRVPPINFSLGTAIKSRAAAVTVPKESPIYKSGGLIETVGGASVAYTIDSAPVIPGLSVYRAFGSGTNAGEAEQGQGGIIKTLEWSGGESELLLKATGAFASKNHLGWSISGTLIDAADTTLALTTASDAYRFGLGFYLIEAEVVKVTAVDYTTGILTVTRAQVGTVAAAHAAVPIYPYVPALTLAGSPISEQNLTVTIDAVAIRAVRFRIALQTGVKHLPGESGSKYAQGIFVGRMNAEVEIGAVLSVGEVQQLGKATQRKNQAISIVCGTGAGGIVTFSLPFNELMPVDVPDEANDESIIALKFRSRDSTTGNDMFSLTQT